MIEPRKVIVNNAPTVINLVPATTPTVPVPTLQEVLDAGSQATIDKLLSIDVGSINLIQLAGLLVQISGGLVVSGDATFSGGITSVVGNNNLNQLENDSYRSAILVITGAWDMQAGQVAEITLNNSTTITATNTTPATAVLWVVQDATGGHTATFDNNTFVAIDEDAVNTDPNTYTLYVFVRDKIGKYRGSGKTFAQ